MKKWDGFFRPFSQREYHDYTSRHAPLLCAVKHSGKSIVEVGSGSGVLSIFLSRLGNDVVAVDNNEHLLSVARENNRRFHGKVQLQLADAFHLPFRSRSVDVCFSQGLLEHFDDAALTRLLKEQMRVAQVAICSVPSFWYPQRDLGDERLMKKEDWLNILAEFTVTEAVCYCRSRANGKGRPQEMYFKIEGLVE